MQLRLVFLLLILVPSIGCESTYYSAMEKVGYHKRDILVDRIQDTQKAQIESKEQFESALHELKALVNFDGGDLEKTYNKLKDEFEDSEDAASQIRTRIEAVEDVAADLFKEWENELNQYSNKSLRRSSAKKLSQTKSRYQRLIKAMRNAEGKIEPVLNVLRDHVLFLKHNLNAQAIASLKSELKSVQVNVNQLIKAMEKSIDESKAFIDELGTG